MPRLPANRNLPGVNPHQPLQKWDIGVGPQDVFCHFCKKEMTHRCSVVMTPQGPMVIVPLQCRCGAYMVDISDSMIVKPGQQGFNVRMPEKPS